MQNLSIVMFLIVFTGLAVMPSLSYAQVQTVTPTNTASIPQKQTSIIDRLNAFKTSFQQRFAKPITTQTSANKVPNLSQSFSDRINALKAGISKTNLGQQVKTQIKTTKSVTNKGPGLGQKISTAISNLKASVKSSSRSGSSSSSGGSRK